MARQLYWSFLGKVSSAAGVKARSWGVPESVLRCRIATNRYGSYCVPDSGRRRPAAAKLLAGLVHEPRTIEFVQENCGHGDIVQAGAFFGDFLPAMSLGCRNGAKVWAFEPVRESFRCAEITVRLNQLENVVLISAALGEREERLEMATVDALGRAAGGSSRIVSPSEESSATETVDIVSLDSVMPAQRHVSVIQLDVEGFEQQALAGALLTIRRCRPIIVLEQLPGADLTHGSWFRDNILAAGYSGAERFHDNLVFRCTR